MRKLICGAWLVAAFVLVIAGGIGQLKGIPDHEILLFGGMATLLGATLFLVNLSDGWEKRAIAMIGSCTIIALVAQGVTSYFKGLAYLPPLKAAGVIVILQGLLFARLDGDRNDRP